jgi:hypothetical protein
MSSIGREGPMITTAKLSRVAGLCAVAAGLLYITVQLIHPDENVEAVTTTAWTATHLVTLAMAVLGLIGVSGMYFRQVRETGLLGLIGFALFGSFFLVVVAVTFVETIVLPTIAEEAPGYVNDFLATIVGETVRGDVGSFTVANGVAGVTYLLGGLLFGIGLYRANVLARWAALLLAIGSFATLAVAVLPESLDRVAVLPVGIALVGLGYSLWRQSDRAV